MNPIEVLFGLCKKQLQREYDECKNIDLKFMIAKVMKRFSKYDMKNLFRKCGYMKGGKFNPVVDQSELSEFGFKENNIEKASQLF